MYVNQGLLKPNSPLPKDPGRYTAVAPALAVSETLAAIHPGLAAFQFHHLQTTFSPSKQDVDLTSIQRQIDDLKQDTNKKIGKLEQENIELKQENDERKQEIVELKQEIVELKQEIVELKQEIVELQQDNDVKLKQEMVQLRGLNTSMLGRIANLEKGIRGDFSNFG